jgi:hypothetical protein
LTIGLVRMSPVPTSTFCNIHDIVHRNQVVICVVRLKSACLIRVSEVNIRGVLK